MRFKSFRIENFRGIACTSLNLSRIPNGRINVLVGLNESGKTTVLEGIHHFLSNPNLLKKVPSAAKRTAADCQAMLPISKRALFNGNIEIAALVHLEDRDRSLIDQFLKEKFKFVTTDRIDEFRITHRTVFADSARKSVVNQWSVQFSGKKKRGTAAKTVFLKDTEWLEAANFVETLLPKIVYFPSTLLEFPDRIVLESSDEEMAEPRNEFYCNVVQDVLRAINPGLKLDAHIVAREKSTVKADKENLDALLIQMAQNLKKTVFLEWEKIFGRSPDYRDFRVSLRRENGQLSLEVKILTDEGIFSINERSSGFRWFFAFILLTRYRLNREDRVLFLFDEPAANLHPNAQIQLLKSFELLASDADILYSTHSHYLVNPLWLESTHIVQNAGAKPDDSFLNSSPLASSIVITPYRTFVGSHPEQYFYYKPIQEALDYAPSPLEFPKKVILVEGKTDFFLLRYFRRLLEPEHEFPPVFPGGGAGSLDPLISLLDGWGKIFVVLVDSDAAGRTQKQRYAQKFEQVVAGRLFSLEDIDSKWNKYRIEELIEKSDKELIRSTCFPEQAKLTKKHLHLAIQELIATDQNLMFSAVTLENIRRLLGRLSTELEVLAMI